MIRVSFTLTTRSVNIMRKSDTHPKKLSISSDKTFSYHIVYYLRNQSKHKSVWLDDQDNTTVSECFASDVIRKTLLQVDVFDS